MDLEKLQTMRYLLKDLYRRGTGNFPAASISEAVDVLIECMEFILDSYQPERLNPEAREGCDSLNSLVTTRGRSEEVTPPDEEDDFKCVKCVKCRKPFMPHDWLNDICDNCLYKRVRS